MTCDQTIPGTSSELRYTVHRENGKLYVNIPYELNADEVAAVLYATPWQAGELRHTTDVLQAIVLALTVPGTIAVYDAETQVADDTASGFSIPGYSERECARFRDRLDMCRALAYGITNEQPSPLPVTAGTAA